MGEPAKSRVVVVEDDPLTRELLVCQLETAGYEVTACADGRAALQPISAMNSGIVIADWSMPEMDGPALCQAVREMQAMHALGSVYFLLLTAHNSKENVVAGLAAGANDYLTKPYHPGELLARLHVGERMLRLQREILHRSIELQKANAQMVLLANKLQSLANTDALTRLASRRRLFDCLAEAWQAAELNGLPLSCVMLDVDRFKEVNDTYGHAAGDRVLQVVAEAIRRTVRRPDLCGRFGGDEFLLLLPATPLSDAVALAERLRTEIAARPGAYEAAAIPITVSCGVAEKVGDTTCPDELIRNADAVLYLAKEHGRNQSWLFDSDGQGRPVEAAAAGTGIALDRAAPCQGSAPDHVATRARSGPRSQPLQCRRAHPDHKR